MDNERGKNTEKDVLQNEASQPAPENGIKDILNTLSEKKSRL